MASTTIEKSLSFTGDLQPSSTDKGVEMQSPDPTDDTSHAQQKGEDSKNESSNYRPQEMESQKAWLTGIPLIMATLGVTLVTMLFMLDVAIVTTVDNTLITVIRVLSNVTLQAIPRITTEFHSLQDIGWYGSAYTISRYAAMDDFFRACSITPCTVLLCNQ